MCVTNGVRCFRGRRLCSTCGRILNMQSSYNSTVAAGILTETAFICSFQFVYWGKSLRVCCIHPTRSYPRFSARSNSLSRLTQHSNTRMPDGAGTREATGEGVTELVTALPHCGSVTVQYCPYLVIGHLIIRCEWCVNALWVGLWKYIPRNPNPRATLTSECVGGGKQLQPKPTATLTLTLTRTFTEATTVAPTTVTPHCSAIYKHSCTSLQRYIQPQL